MSLIRCALGFGALAISMVAATTANANLLTNGSFEQGPALAPGAITQLGPNDLPGWTLSGANPWFWYMSTGQFGTAQQGDRFINITSPSLSQGFAVTAGTTYTVSYYEALRADGGVQPDTIQATIALAAGSATGVTSQLANNPLTNGTIAGWVPFTFAFTPNTSTTATLAFSLNNGAGYPVLDNVSVVGVPEPATLVLLGLGAIGLFFASRRRLRA